MSFLRKCSLIFCQSFFFFITSLLYICLSVSYSHCISSILSDSVCLFCRSFVFYVSSFLSLFCQLLFLLLTSLLYICLSTSYFHCISSILSDSVCLFCRSFPFLRHCCIFVFRCCFPTVFRQFSPFLLAFSVILLLSYVSSFHFLFCLSILLFPTSLLCICLSMSYYHCISSILSDFVCPFCRSFVLPTSALSLLCLSLSLFPLLRSLLCICLSLKFPHCISSNLSDLASYLPDFVVCLLSLSFYFFLMCVLSFLCFSCRSFCLFRGCLLLSLSHCISSILSVFVCFLCNSFSFL